jgi:UDP-N-acetylmuramoyl-L-alanyl-D-glutamate--2,6-diaminopimelate ligase
LGAVGVGCALGLSDEVIARGIARLAAVPGRLEKVDNGRGVAVLVDYAHTPDALEKALQVARQLTAGRLIAVFGCGGDRDRGKRGLMGRAAVRGADFAIVTDDNPRNESPGVIRGEAMKGAEEAWKAGEAPAGAEAPLEIAGRRRALEAAFTRARPGDAVVVAGKGHEMTQTVGGTKLPFDDRAEARRALEGLGFSGGPDDGEAPR